MRILSILAVLAIAPLAASCGLLYTIDVQQGNYVTQETAAKLKVGMTKNEVRQLLGTPLLRDVFHSDRWDYYFSNVSGGRAEGRTQLTVLFKDDKVTEWRGSGRTAPPRTGTTTTR